ncbi:hypothetical protein Q3G72_008235 [Acer saccharum]|nr:hypothetical protein Q3G72_008235 [Acer saccharum]
MNLDDYSPDDPILGSPPTAPGPIERGNTHPPNIPKLRSPYPPRNVGSQTAFVRANAYSFLLAIMSPIEKTKT